ncbi:hypothetical protein LOTGIDRAFT_167765 [Lottia gigantea]|uniref:Uncharacterized protein n=1 Tax=Lottia gigantea TaxID=225164 RepID=V3ZXS7_LOTGI|nr:hypothetical protein LOTGIDRAFT_167765 [Lottia gigantea]ESO85791.1 hypothetical protein LOTGIDRAFT_167765 [Lottia gigantea]
MSKRVKFPYHKTLLLSIVISIIGLGCMLEAIIGLTLHIWGDYFATGVWCGVIIFTAGVSGILSSYYKGFRSVQCYFICSALATVMSLVMIVMSAAGLDFNSNFYKDADYFKQYNKKSTFFCYVAALTFSLLALIGNLASLFFCVQHNSFYHQKSRKHSSRSSFGRSKQGNYLRASTHSRSTLRSHDPDTNTCIILEQTIHYAGNGPPIVRKSQQTLEKRGDSSSIPKHKRRKSDLGRTSGKTTVDLNISLQNNKKECSRTPNQKYRSLPSRSKHHHPPGAQSEVGQTLLPTAFNEDELPSYDDALKCPPPQKYCKPWNQIVNDDSQVMYRHSDMGAVYEHSPKGEQNELDQNLHNEGVEMDISSQRNIAMNDPQPSTSKSLLPAQNKSSSQFSEVDPKSEMPAFEVNKNLKSSRAFTSPISIGSPQSAFTPVKRRASQRMQNIDSNQGCDIEQQDSTEGSSSNNADSLWKNIVLPSLHMSNNNCDNSGVNEVQDLSNNTHMANAGNLCNDQEDNIQRNEPAGGQQNANVQINNHNIDQHQPLSPVLNESRNTDTPFYSQIL